MPTGYCSGPRAPRPVELAVPSESGPFRFLPEPVRAASIHHMNQSTKNLTLLWLAYLVTLVLAVTRHEMWRDEHQAWTLVTHSATLGELWQNTRYEGHPLLWFLLLWPLARLTNNAVAMQVVHTLLALASGYLVVFRSPFRFFEKAALLFGYYLLFEYGAIVRNYQPGVLLAFLAALEWGKTRPSYPLLGLLLFLLCQTNAYAALLAVGIGAGVFLEGGFSVRRMVSKDVLAYALPLSLGVVVFALTTRPPADASFAPDWFVRLDGERLKQCLSSAAQGLLPIPGRGFHFWNSTAFMPLVGSLVLLLSLWLGWRLLRRNAGSGWVFLVTCGLMLLFTYTKMLPSLRHAGHLFLAFVVGYWHLCQRAADDREPLPGRWFAEGVLLVQALTGVFAVAVDAVFPFSNSKATAAYLKTLPSAPVAGSPDHLLTPLAGYLQKEVYFLGTQQPGSFVKWRQSDYNLNLITLPDTALVRRALPESKPYGTPVRLVVARRFITTLPVQPGQIATVRTGSGPVRVTCLRAFEGAIQDEEDYVVFNLEPERAVALTAGTTDTQR